MKYNHSFCVCYYFLHAFNCWVICWSKCYSECFCLCDRIAILFLYLWTDRHFKLLMPISRLAQIILWSSTTTYINISSIRVTSHFKKVHNLLFCNDELRHMTPPRGYPPLVHVFVALIYIKKTDSIILLRKSAMADVV